MFVYLGFQLGEDSREKRNIAIGLFSYWKNYWIVNRHRRGSCVQLCTPDKYVATFTLTDAATSSATGNNSAVFVILSGSASWINIAKGMPIAWRPMDLASRQRAAFN